MTRRFISIFWNFFFYLSVDVNECGGHSRKKRLAWWPQTISSSPTIKSGKLFTSLHYIRCVIVKKTCYHERESTILSLPIITKYVANSSTKPLSASNPIIITVIIISAKSKNHILNNLIIFSFPFLFAVPVATASASLSWNHSGLLNRC